MSFEDIKAEGTRLLNAGDFSGAAAKYAEALAVAPDDVARGALHSNISLAHLKRGALADAERSAATCASLRPEWEKGHFRVGEAAFAARRYEDAVEAYDEALARKPDDPVIAKRLSLAREAVSGFYFRQLLPGRDIALRPSNPSTRRYSPRRDRCKTSSTSSATRDPRVRRRRRVLGRRRHVRRRERR